jgi:Holliday junction resolvasome RuvABC endonuclease subunit
MAANFTGRVQEVCDEHNIPYASVHTGTLKLSATGHGNSSKERMCEQAAIVLRRKPTSDDEADAVWVALCAFNQYGVK